MIGEEYCDCGSGSNTPVSCPEGEQFCDAIGDESPEKKTKICLHLWTLSRPASTQTIQKTVYLTKQSFGAI